VSRPLLPASTDELRGLRARRYVRVSTEDQGTKYGPERQHEEVGLAIARLGLVEAGPAFVDEASGFRRSAQRPALIELVDAAAQGEYDVLVMAYFSRWGRDAEVALRIRRELHDAGVVLFFADEWFLSSDADKLETFVTEAAAAEVYSIKLSRTIAKTLRTKFDRYGDQAGTPPAGFRRTPQPEARMVVDPAAMPRVVALFERYAEGDVSYRELAAEAHVPEAQLRAILTNPLYNGWARRHRRRADEIRAAAPWRSSPPVSDELWARVADVRSRRAKAAGRARSRHVHLLAKRLWCPCGRAVKGDTSRQKNGRLVKRYVHQGCDRWSQENIVAHRLDGPIVAQVTGLRLDAATLSRIRAIAGQPAPVTTDLRRAQLEHELRAKATAHAARRLTTDAYLAEHGRITAAIDALAAPAPAAPVGDADDVVAALADLRAVWRDAQTDEARARLVAAIYSRITVEDGSIVEVELTEAAKRNGLIFALPETVAMARPAGARPSQATSVRIPIAGRADWLRSARTA
jgi:DNA invertase Pin-like site-specific DNA recombinase